MGEFNNKICMLMQMVMIIRHVLATEPYVDQFMGSDFGYSYGEGYLNDWSPDRNWGMGGRLHQPRCVDIPSNMTLCQNIGYDAMRLPNLLEHDTIQEVLQQSSQWLMLMNRQCHPDTKVFLCSLFSPVCLDRLIYPCRSLCESVKGGCEQHMVKYGYPWPEMLNCEKFPLEEGLCIGMVSQRKEEEASCTPCSQPNTFEAIVDNYCSSSSVYRTKLRSERTEGDEKVIRSGKKIRKMKGTNPTAEQRRNGLNIYIPNSQKCDCGLGHDRSPDYYAMGNYVNGKFYANAFHLYERNNDELKRALRAIRKTRNICQNVGLEMLVVNDQPQPPIKSRKKKNQKPKVKTDIEPKTEARENQEPTAEEIARRKAERNERRRQERLALKKKRKQKANQKEQQDQKPDASQGQSSNVGQSQNPDVSQSKNQDVAQDSMQARDSGEQQKNSKERDRSSSRERQAKQDRGQKAKLTPEQRQAREERRRQREMKKSGASQN